MKIYSKHRKGKYCSYAERGRGGGLMTNLEIFSLSSYKLDEHTTRDLFLCSFKI